MWTQWSVDLISPSVGTGMVYIITEFIFQRWGQYCMSRKAGRSHGNSYHKTTGGLTLENV